MDSIKGEYDYLGINDIQFGQYGAVSLQHIAGSHGQHGANVAGRKRDFDVIVIGGGTFGSVVAEHLFVADKTRSRRILVLEAGPFVLPEHFQNMPFRGGAPTCAFHG